MASAPSSSDSTKPGFLDTLPPVVRAFVLGAVALHVVAFVVWGVLLMREQRQGKVKSKEF
jgi:negative regulator of sigma E activity